MVEFKDKKVVVTGSTRGLGKFIADEFEAQSARVIRNGRDSNGFQFIPSRKGGTVYCDVARPEGAEFLVDVARRELGGIDILVCNVGNGASCAPGTETYEEWQSSFCVNFFSTTNVIEKATKYLKETSGNIVCISSICGVETVPDAPTTYSVAKAALNFYVKNASRYLANHSIRINAIAPGNLYFKGSSWEKKYKLNPSGIEEIIKNDVPLKKFGKPEDIVELCIWLSSEKASFITGSVIVSDGGQTRST